MDLPEKFKKKLRKEGIDPDNIPEVTEITPDIDGQFVKFKGTIAGVCVRLSPPITIIKDGVETALSIKIMDKNIRFEKERVFLELSGESSRREITETYNDIFNLYNLIGIPFDFISDYEIILMAKVGSQLIETNLTPQALLRGDGIQSINVEYEEFQKMNDFANLVYNKIQGSSLYDESQIWKFFGKGIYFAFHGEKFSTFLNCWYYIESVINWLWKENTSIVFTTHKPHQNTNLVTKIDELFLMGLIQKKAREVIHDLRKKRNLIFHVDPNPEKRGVEEEEVNHAFNLAFSLFFKSLSITYPNNLGLNELRDKMNVSLRSFFNPNLE